MLLRFLTAAAAASLALIAPLVASAQDAPSYAHPAVPSYGTQDEEIHGRIIGFDGGYAVQLRDDHGYVDTVRLHQGTVINPIGLTLEPGMVVSIDGYNAGSYFAANEIDTPYTFYGPVPFYEGRPWYAYGPTVSLGFFFGDSHWYRGRAEYVRRPAPRYGDRRSRDDGRH
jgi:hypothetical protein